MYTILEVHQGHHHSWKWCRLRQEPVPLWHRSLPGAREKSVSICGSQPDDNYSACGSGSWWWWQYFGYRDQCYYGLIWVTHPQKFAHLDTGNLRPVQQENSSLIDAGSGLEVLSKTSCIRVSSFFVPLSCMWQLLGIDFMPWSISQRKESCSPLFLQNWRNYNRSIMRAGLKQFQVLSS